LYWLPFTGLFYGGLLSLGGVGLVVVGQFFQAVTTSTAIYLVARPWGRSAAWMMVIFWWADLGYQVYFHMVGADGMMVWLIPFWMLALRYAVQFQRPAFWTAAAVIVCLNTLMRGGNLLLLVSLGGLLLSGAGHAALKTAPLHVRHFIKNLLAAVLPVIVILGGVSLYNGLRYGHYGITRGSNIIWWSTVYYPESYVASENGAATRRFAGYVESILLTHPLYEDITLDEFFAVPSHRFIDDARAIPDLTDGWHTNYAIFREIAWEAFQKHPTEIVLMRTEAFARILLTKEALRMPAGSTAFADTNTETMLIDRPALEFMRSQPDNTLADPQRTAKNDAQLNTFVAPIDRPDGHVGLADWIGWLWVRLGISPLLWGVGVLLALLKSRGRSQWFLLLLLVGMVLVVLPTSMVNMQPRYRIPFDPILILCLVVSFIPKTET
ncbi:MAG: hypothetical protein K8I82_23790, partial [Anaerolineae bacterium]|nr:hypothetical protein [Anaerolineae bacterium]